VSTLRNVAQLQAHAVDDDVAVELRIAQENLRRVETHFRATMEQLPIGVAQVDLDDRIIRFNRAFCAMLGFTAEELAGKRFPEITYPEDLVGSEAAMQRLWHGEVDFFTLEKRYIKKDGGIVWARVTVAPSRDANGTLYGAVGTLEDISQRKAAEAEIERVHKELVRASRQAGMAEVATNVLHNVGNVLNSLNVSANLIADNVRGLKGDSLARVVALLNANAASLGAFLTTDERGRRIPEFLGQLTAHLQTTQGSLLAELESLSRNIDHIKDIVATQQAYAKRCGVTERVAVASLVEDSLAMNRGAFARHGVNLVRQFATVPEIIVDKHKVLQILVNLQRNAKYACDASGRTDKNITVRIGKGADGGVQIDVIDNGVGISPEIMQRLFTHGFTTKKDGHGFGLHGGALTAKEIGGTLSAHSAGIGRGATFTLILPLTPPEEPRG
jgi:PAS domain S-box-containing protein